jgi:hypothetical protein
VDPHVVNYIDAQHCLAIAAAFIAIIAACASLISGANSKADSLTNRIHEVAREFREIHEADGDLVEGVLGGASARCKQIKEQIVYYNTRFKKVQHAQRFLFLTISIFVTCLAVFIGLGLYISYFHVPDITAYPVAGVIFGGIGLGVLFGTLFMLLAIYLHFSEVWQSYDTLCIEMGPCQKSLCHDTDCSGLPSVRPRPSIAARSPEIVGS